MTEHTTTEAVPELKMWLAVRTDLPLSYGKFATQAGHAYGDLHVLAARARPEIFAAYLAKATPKISVRVASEEALRRVEQEAAKSGIPTILVKDAGRTEIPPGTPTMCAFGPAYRADLPNFLKRLQKLGDDDFQMDVIFEDPAFGRLTWRLPAAVVARLADLPGGGVEYRAGLRAALSTMAMVELGGPDDGATSAERRPGSD